MSAIGWLAAAAVVLTLLAGLCAAADSALARVSRPRVQKLVDQGRRGARRLQAVISDAPRYLNVLLLLRVICELSATIFVAAAFVRGLGPGWAAFGYTLLVMSVVSYVAVGVSPRTFGQQHPEGLGLAASAVLYPLARVLGPLPRLLIRVGNALTPGPGLREGPFASEAELRDLVDLLERRRVIEPGEREMIHSVFEFGDTIVREVMVPRTDMVFIERGKTLRQAMSLALRSGFSRIPVIGENEDDVIGVAYLKDIVARSYEHRESESAEKVESIMRSASFVPDSKPIDDLLREMQARQIHLAIVIDEYGGTAGLVTIEDILEEIVGEITDEYDQEIPPVEWIAPDTARVTARLSVDELSELFGVKIDAEDVETVGGLLAHALGRVPIAGSEAATSGLRLTAESPAGRRNRIGTVVVKRLESSQRSTGAAPSAGSGDRPERRAGQAAARRAGQAGGRAQCPGG